MKATGSLDPETWSLLIPAEPQAPAPLAVTPEPPVLPAEPQITLDEINSKLQSQETVKRIQQALKDAGYDPGSIDGKIGPKTRKAIAEFQSEHNFNAGGGIDVQTWLALGDSITD